MPWLRNTPVNRKMLVGFGAVVVLLAIVSLSAYVGLKDVQGRQTALFTETFGNVYDLARLRVNLNAERLDISNMIESPPSERARWREDMEKRSKQDDELLQQLRRNLANDPVAMTRLNELSAVRDAFKATRSEQIRMLDSGNTAEARRLFSGVQLERHNGITSIAKEMEESETSGAEVAVEDIERKTRGYIAASTTLGALAIAVAVVLAVFLNRTTNNYLAERKRIEGELRTASLNVRSLIEASLDPMVTISAEGKITDVNRATESATGRSREQLIGSDFASYFTEPDKAQQGYKQVLAQSYVRDYPLGLRHATGHVMDVLYNASIFRNEAGEVQGVFAAARDVTERRQLEKKLTQSSAYTRSLIEASLDPLVTISPDGKITDVNKATEEATGVAREQLIGSDFANYFAEPERARQGYQQALSLGLVRDFPLGLRHISGRITEVLYNASVFRNPRGEVQGVFAAARDVTERRQLEMKLTQSSAYTRSLIEASLDPLLTISAEGKITDVNRATEEATGVARERLVGSDFANYFTEPEKARRGYQQALAQGLVRDYPLGLRHTSGRITEVIYNASVYRNAQGEVQGVFAAARDITERKQLETKLTQSFAYTRSLIEASLDPLLTISAEGKITDVNRAMEEVTGVARDRLVGSDFSNYFTEPDRARQGYQQVLAQGLVRDYPLSLRHLSGRITEVIYNASVFRNEKGEVQGVFAAARDITERRQLEIKLTRSSAYTRSLIEVSLDPLVTISPEGKITDVNKATEEVTGVARERLVGSDFANYFTEPERARQGYQQVLAQGFVRDYPLALRHVSGKVTDVNYNASVFRNEKGEVQGVFAAARDVTERKELERKVQERSERLEKVLQEAREAVSVLTSSASEILSVISQLASGATEAATSVSETTTTVEEVRQTAQLSNQKAKDIAEAGQNAAQVLQAGQRSVEASVTEMKRIRDQMDSIAETIVTLSEQSQAIGEITGTVNDLAEQSNLLAVNAAIEAAKAGEQGKGFAVVSQEIKSLAEQSKQATSQVKNLLADIQRAIANAVMATEQTSKVVETGVAQSKQAGESILAAVGATQRVAHASSQIAISSQQQLTGVDQVAMAMESINKASTQNALSTKQVESVAQNLHELSQKLKALVG